MAKKELAIAIEQLCEEKNIPYDSVMDAIEASLAVAYRKEFGNKLLNCSVEFNADDGSMRIFDVKTVTEDQPEEELVAAEEPIDEFAKPVRRNELSDEEVEDKFNPRTDIGITDAKQIKPDAELGDQIISELPVPGEFGRVAAQTAKQVIIQKIREAERDTLYDQYKDRAGEIINATVQRVEGRMVYMDLGQASAKMPPSEQIRNEKYKIGDRYKVLLLSIEQSKRGPEIIASRASAEMVRSLFAMEVPEVAAGSIDIKSIAREAGGRTKIAVQSLEDNIDPIGSCVGQRGSRVQTVINELGGEKIDIIEYSDDPVQFIVNALSPAKVVSVQLNDATKQAKAYVQNDQLSLAIGKGGQNVRLAAKLSGWKIDVLEDGAPTDAETVSEDAPVEDVVEAPVVEVPADETPAAVEADTTAEVADTPSETKA